MAYPQNDVRAAPSAAKVAAILTVAALAFPARPAAAQTVIGQVLDDATSAPLAVTTVMLLDSTDTAGSVGEADSTGWFALRAPADGRYRLFADRLGYGEVVSDTLAVRAGPSTEVEIRMVPTPVELEAVVVSAERRRLRLEEKGYYRRRDVSPGYFLDAENIVEQRPQRTTDLLRMMPGLRVLPDQYSFGYTVSNARFFRPCPVRFVLDGWSVEVGDQTIDDFVHPSEIIGIEVYPAAGGAGAPGRYRGPESFCGIVMIWTR